MSKYSSYLAILLLTAILPCLNYSSAQASSIIPKIFLSSCPSIDTDNLSVLELDVTSYSVFTGFNFSGVVRASRGKDKWLKSIGIFG